MISSPAEVSSSASISLISTSDIFKKKHTSEKTLDSEWKIKKSQVMIKKVKVKKKEMTVKKKFHDMDLDQVTAEWVTKNMSIAKTMTWHYKYNFQITGAAVSILQADTQKHDHSLKTDLTIVKKKTPSKYSSNSATEKAHIKQWSKYIFIPLIYITICWDFLEWRTQRQVI